jgi:hypothetical protein
VALSLDPDVRQLDERFERDQVAVLADEDVQGPDLVAVDQRPDEHHLGLVRDGVEVGPDQRCAPARDDAGGDPWPRVAHL